MPLFFYTFDIMMLSGKSVMELPLNQRRELLEKKVLPKLGEAIRFSPDLGGLLSDLLQSVRAQGLEGLGAKRRDSRYEPGMRSGAWQKLRLNQGQEFVIGGYTVGTRPFDALVIGYYEKGKLIYASRTRNGFTPASREKLFQRLKRLETSACPFANLPEIGSGRWLKPVTVGQFEFVEWTPDGHLRHTHFVALREDTSAKNVHGESYDLASSQRGGARIKSPVFESGHSFQASYR